MNIMDDKRISKSFRVSSSSLLEVKEFDSVGKDKEEEEDQTKMSNDNDREEVVVITQVFFEVILHGLTVSAWYFQKRVLITYLRSHEAVQCPRNW